MTQINLTEFDRRAIALIIERFNVSTEKAIEIHLQLLARKQGIDLPPVQITKINHTSDDGENYQRGE